MTKQLKPPAIKAIVSETIYILALKIMPGTDIVIKKYLLPTKSALLPFMHVLKHMWL
jgi:hypothetical protein